ncbi:phosphoadenylyl-sulfate reductase [Rarobacter faecitabidus]|uniref:Adenosine 5'-phosphosulfate reductase n=1 Tax=Rarobacter faecitabidus TaxID=13243 RepID=A0A542ZXS5_RARFA|nr:phosphoadenylyl-sulfate reductase [Rarobacter faecitabidus]TQL65010.1 phosphoadenosine phosphosulfate reductase [Rarobacter faecitabidus]
MTGVQADPALTSLFRGGSAPLRSARQRAREEERATDVARRARERRVRRSEDELRALAEEGRALLHGSGVGADDEADTAAVMAWVTATFGDRIAVASSMADTVLPHVVSSYKPWIDVLFLDTGYHFAQTLETRDRAARELRISVVTVTGARTVAEQDEALGPELFRRDPTECCRLRKVVPLRERLRDYEVWISGVRRADAPSRAQAPLVAWDQANRLVKVNPIAGWSDEQVDAYLAANDIVVNPLLSQGYPSIGCEPCTSKVAPGEDPRSGRWAGQTKTECGLHVI